jgi:NSS family neurotransmitter:Na+ symporter
VHFVFLQIIVFGVLLSGVKDGIERQARILMPTLFVMLVGLIVFVMTLDNAGAGIRYYLVPDFSQFDSTVVNAALNQAFFSLSLGMGIMITYGSYFGRADSIPGSSRFVAVADTTVAFLAGLLVLPAIFAFNPATNPEELSSSSVGHDLQRICRRFSSPCRSRWDTWERVLWRHILRTRPVRGVHLAGLHPGNSHLLHD